MSSPWGYHGAGRTAALSPPGEQLAISKAGGAEGEREKAEEHNMVPARPSGRLRGISDTQKGEVGNEEAGSTGWCDLQEKAPVLPGSTFYNPVCRQLGVVPVAPPSESLSLF